MRFKKIVKGFKKGDIVINDPGLLDSQQQKVVLLGNPTPNPRNVGGFIGRVTHIEGPFQGMYTDRYNLDQYCVVVGNQEDFHVPRKMVKLLWDKN